MGPPRQARLYRPPSDRSLPPLDRPAEVGRGQHRAFERSAVAHRARLDAGVDGGLRLPAAFESRSGDVPGLGRRRIQQRHGPARRHRANRHAHRPHRARADSVAPRRQPHPGPRRADARAIVHGRDVVSARRRGRLSVPAHAGLAGQTGFSPARGQRNPPPLSLVEPRRRRVGRGTSARGGAHDRLFRTLGEAQGNRVVRGSDRTIRP